MISARVAGNQIVRLAGLDGFPTWEPKAQEELQNALRFVARSDKHAEEIVFDWIYSNSKAPTAADFYAMKGRDEFSSFGATASSCVRCGGTKWISEVSQPGLIGTARRCPDCFKAAVAR